MDSVLWCFQEYTWSRCWLSPIDPCGIQTYFSYHLESKCTNNNVKYEALIQGLRKAIDLKVKSIEVFGDSRLVIEHVRNFMFNTFHHLNKHQQVVWNLIIKFIYQTPYFSLVIVEVIGSTNHGISHLFDN